MSGGNEEWLGVAWVDPPLEGIRAEIQKLRAGLNPFGDSADVNGFANKPATKGGKPIHINQAAYLALNLLRGWIWQQSDGSLKHELGVELLTRILRGEEPNQVFGWKPKRGRQPRNDSLGFHDVQNVVARVIYLNREGKLPIEANRDAKTISPMRTCPRRSHGQEASGVVSAIAAASMSV